MLFKNITPKIQIFFEKDRLRTYIIIVAIFIPIKMWMDPNI